MTLSKYSDIAALIEDIYEGAYFTLRANNALVRTVTVFSENRGMAPRKATLYSAANVRPFGEGDSVTATAFNRTALSTLTPARYADQVILTDQRIATDPQDVRVDVALEMGAAFAEFVDAKIASNFADLTGGSFGALDSALTWAHVLRARALLHNAKVPAPYFCALHPYQWLRLVESAALSGTELQQAPAFQDALVSTYFVASLIGGVTFVVTPSIAVEDDNAVGAMYSPLALAYDERRAFNMRPQRNEAREALELNFSLWFAHGVWRPSMGVKLIGLATLPS
ncbi:MAG: hypothetical protein CUN51_06570 [Candidatus Thermofonsia Clade 1 bacterium]|uniref:Phage major capsid protein n=1 Tax=Candidatus Thermofonsia Clade 1 bacterium TaxID=2364210 RepID=A0A2M8NZX5_9CHLR|nr:MAG: hypothetical protein CUN51_06570 [Candidatus Thermofonsia Clade 1 bacterium]